MKFNGQAAVITGAARGIGKAIAFSFIREGARVALVDMDQKSTGRRTKGD